MQAYQCHCFVLFSFLLFVVVAVSKAFLQIKTELKTLILFCFTPGFCVELVCTCFPMYVYTLNYGGEKKGGGGGNLMGLGLTGRSLQDTHDLSVYVLYGIVTGAQHYRIHMMCLYVLCGIVTGA